MAQDLKQLEIWKESIAFHKILISEITKFPKEEFYARGSQLRRAPLSISNNLAEGCGRQTINDFKNFLHISMGSVKEVESMLIIARDLGYLTQMTFDDLNEKINTIGRKLNVFTQKAAGGNS